MRLTLPTPAYLRWLEMENETMLVVVPNYLRDKINRKLDEQFELHPDAAKDRDSLYSQLLAYVNEHGVVPDFTLAKTEAA